jgi:decaprenyl-phosphate phosphoribosyltransferase
MANSSIVRRPREAVARQRPTLLGDLIAIARPEHWFKNVFMLPGAALALALADESLAPELAHLLLGVVSTCLIVSANYTINEWLDAESDRHHPAKRHRPRPPVASRRA